MRYILLVTLLASLAGQVKAQKTYTIKADSVKLTNCDSSELIIENHTQSIPGFLYNTGRGRTIFKRGAQQLGNGSYLIGSDTLKTYPNAWLQGGNTFGTTGIWGTLDNNPLIIYTNNTERMRVFNSGGIAVNYSSDEGYKLRVNGNAKFDGLLTAQSGATFFNPLGFGGNSSQNLVFANILTFTTSNSLPNNIGGVFLFTNALPSANSGTGTFRLINVNKVVNRGTQDGEETAMRVDFTVSGSAGDLRALDAIHGNVVVEAGNVQVGAATGSTSKIDITGANGYSQLRIRTQYTPPSSSDTNGNLGDIAVDNNYFYYKTSTGWKRVALSAF